MKNFNERMNDFVILKNVTERDQCFSTIAQPKGVILSPGGTASVSVSDLRTSLNNDPFLYGIDSVGTFATLYIEDEEMREILKFDEYTYKDGKRGKQTRKQLLLTKDNFLGAFKSKKEGFEEFIENLGELSVGNKMTLKKILSDEENKSLKSVTHSRVTQAIEALRYL